MIKKAIICQYCDAGITHIIYPTNYKNDIIAKKINLAGNAGIA
jgi:hypothetical protein